MTTPGPVAWLKAAIEADADWKPPSETRLAEALATGEISVNDFRWVRHAAGLLEADRALKLAILDLHKPVTQPDYPGPDRTWLECGECGPNNDYPEIWAAPGEGEAFWPCKTVRLLAGGYRRHPGYGDHWGATQD